MIEPNFHINRLLKLTWETKVGIFMKNKIVADLDVIKAFLF